MLGVVSDPYWWFHVGDGSVRGKTNTVLLVLMRLAKFLLNVRFKEIALVPVSGP